MNETLSSELIELLGKYRNIVDSVNFALSVFESECHENIRLIRNEALCGARKYFDDLHAIQVLLATAKYKFNFMLNDKLDRFVYNFDRYDDCSIEYWYGKISVNEWSLFE